MSYRAYFSALILAGGMSSSALLAGEVEVVAAEFERGDSGWSIEVTLRHGDTGWDHYADVWRVVDGQGHVLGTRTLLHPHVEEQPFTRGLDHVVIEPQIASIYIEAHDKVHGWSSQRLQVDWSQRTEKRFKVQR